MPQQALQIHDLTASEIHKQIDLLTNNLVNIKDETDHFLLKLPDGRIIDTKGWNDWEWTHGIGLYGLYQYYTLTGNDSTLSIIKSWFKDRFREGTTKNINTMSPFLTLAYLYEASHDPTYLPWLDSWAEWAMYDLPRTTYGGMQHITYNNDNVNELWDDTLMMTVLPLIKIGQILNRPHYIEEGKRQFLLHIQYLFDTSTGLFFHGWKFDSSTPGGLGHNFARARWARGNSWLTIVIPDVLDMLNLPPNDHFHIILLDTLRAQISALKIFQDPKTGLWRTLLDVPESEGSYLETSAAAGFAYGILKSIRKRYIPREEYEDVAIKAVKGVLAKTRQEDGELLDVSFGTAMGSDREHYLKIERTSMPYGQAMAIMALGEFSRVFI
ncbi:putative glycoside hydrolase family 105 protein [Phaeomoniella chlamydospora]|uniref:Putative glycoside hydrolase family 105 protein n=1 Tax=Phaeomoniella chlamydospora TaxID=158046 RepID=A0A0G2G8G3_PHACM|nr:putative glycoside hydrolase family 105 protein [Phaeomoniella chlamydospora]